MPPKAARAGPSQMGQLLNLERVPNLAPKFANKIGKSCNGYSVVYDMTGMKVIVLSLLSANGSVLTEPEQIPLLEFERRVALANTPSEAERLLSLRRKYELRLNRAFPAQGPQSGSEAHIQAFLDNLPLAERRALLLSQKDFAKSYPEGFRA